MTDLIALVREFSNAVANNRTPESILAHLKTEVVELDAEVYAELPGDDGVVGEAVDVLLCALDMVFMHSPNITDEQIIAIARRKCQKWQDKYGEPSDDPARVRKDRDREAGDETQG